MWTPGNKLGVGTAYTYDQGGKDKAAPSRVWFEITGGAITDLLFPNVGQDNVRELSLLVAGGPAGEQRDWTGIAPSRPPCNTPIRRRWPTAC